MTFACYFVYVLSTGDTKRGVVKIKSEVEGAEETSLVFRSLEVIRNYIRLFVSLECPRTKAYGSLSRDRKRLLKCSIL